MIPRTRTWGSAYKLVNGVVHRRFFRCAAVNRYCQSLRNILPVLQEAAVASGRRGSETNASAGLVAGMQKEKV
jgi:hypothetical protein